MDPDEAITLWPRLPFTKFGAGPAPKSSRAALDTRLCLLAIIGVCLMWPGPAGAWTAAAHHTISVAAVRSLPEDVPAFFRNGHATIAHCSLDPDLVRQRELPQVRDANSPEHYFDCEQIGDRPWPESRYRFIALCAELKLDPAQVGMLPYAITEWTQWLTMAFAEHRRDPASDHVKMKCLVIAGFLSHYTADLHMLLHTTVHWNGRTSVESGYRSPRTGIHLKVDALPTKNPHAVIFAELLPPPEARADVFSFLTEQFEQSYDLVDRVYELESQIPDLDDPDLADPQVIALAIGRACAAARFSAGIFLSAWRNSANLKLPPRGRLQSAEVQRHHHRWVTGQGMTRAYECPHDPVSL